MRGSEGTSEGKWGECQGEVSIEREKGGGGGRGEGSGRCEGRREGK